MDVSRAPSSLRKFLVAIALTTFGLFLTSAARGETADQTVPELPPETPPGPAQRVERPRIKYWLDERKKDERAVIIEEPAPSAIPEDLKPTELKVGDEILVDKEDPVEHPDYVARRAKLNFEIQCKIDEAKLAFKRKEYERALYIARNILVADPRNVVASEMVRKAQGKLLDADEHVTIVAGERRDREALIEVEEHSVRPPARQPTIRPRLPQRGDDPESARRRTMSEKLNEAVTVDFMKADLEWVLNTLFILTGVNIIADQAALEGKSLTLHVEQLPLKEVLNFIVRNNEGIQYSITEDAVWITATEAADLKKIMFPRIYPLRHGLVSTTKGASVSTGDRGRAERGGTGGAPPPAPPSPTGEGSEKPSYLETVLEWMKENEDPQMFPKGSDYLVDRQTNNLIVYTTPAGHERINEFLNEFDQPPIQVLIKARFLEISASEDKGIGVNLDRLNTRGVDFANPFPSDAPDATPTSTRDPFRAFNLLGGLELPATGSLLTLIGRRTDPQFQVSIRALLSSGKTKVLSQPQILAINNKEATINITQSFSFIDSFDVVQSRVIVTDNSDGSVAQDAYVPVYDTDQVGFTLVVTPSVGRDLKTINLHLNPILDDLSSDSRFDAFTVFTQSNPNAPPVVKRPAIDTRSVETDVVLEDNGYVVIGGLERARRESRERKIPGLHRIPVLGNLFKSTTNNVTRSNLIIIVEAQIITPGGRTYYKDLEGDDVDVREGGVPHAPGQISENSQPNRPDNVQKALGLPASRKYMPGSDPQIRKEEAVPAEAKPDALRASRPEPKSDPRTLTESRKSTPRERMERLTKAAQQQKGHTHAALKSTWDLAEEEEETPAANKAPVQKFVPAQKPAPAADRKDAPRGEVIDLLEEGR
jgi:type II secretory pathway component GspD/PulD (secretin)